jgi:excinuclease UvrABC nuclease subunit
MLDGCTLPKEGTLCIYRLLDNLNDVIYVGKTIHLKTRLYRHLMDGKGFISFSYFTCDEAGSIELERDEILKYNPRLNIELPKTDKYKNIEQARSMIKDVVYEKADFDIQSYVESLEIVFERRAAGTKNHTYVKTEDINTILKELFTNQSNKV